MNVITKIKDEEIGQRSFKFSSSDVKYGAYGIVKHDDKICLINVQNRGYYLLPGSNSCDFRDYRTFFLDSVYEETGSKIEIEKVMGQLEEERSLSKYKEVAYVFVADVVEYNPKEEYSDTEKFLGVKVEWINEDKALTLVASAYDNLSIDDAEDLYRVKFEVKKSQIILEEYLKNK